MRWLSVAPWALCAACAIESAGLGGGGGMDGGSPVGGMDARVRDAGPSPDAPGPFDAFVEDVPAEPDAGPRSYYDLDWGAAEPIDMSSAPDPCGEDQTLDPILTTDLRWLAASRFESDCTVRRFYFYAWNDGEPSYVAMLGPLVAGDTEHNGHLFDGAPVGRADEELLVFTIGGSGTPRELRYAWLTGSPPLTASEPVGSPGTLDGVGAEDGPSLTVDGARLFLSVDQDVVEYTGTPPDSYSTIGGVGPASMVSVEEVDPAISPDGRVLVYSRIAPAGVPDLWVTRRAEVDAAWEPGVALTALNTDDGEWDAFIASNGDLLFTRREGSTQHVYLARAIAP